MVGEPAAWMEQATRPAGDADGGESDLEDAGLCRVRRKQRLDWTGPGPLDGPGRQNAARRPLQRLAVIAPEPRIPDRPREHAFRFGEKLVGGEELAGGRALRVEHLVLHGDERKQAVLRPENVVDGTGADPPQAAHPLRKEQ